MRSVRSWSGVAVPSSAATGAGRPGDSGTSRRPAGVRLGSTAASSSAARIAADRRPISRAPARAWRARATRSARCARSARIRTSPVSGPVAGRCPWRKRLQVAVGRRQPGRLLDLEDQLAAGRPVGARRDDQQVGGAGASVAAIRSAPGDVARARRRGGRRPRRRRWPGPDSSAPIAGRGEQRAEVADRCGTSSGRARRSRRRSRRSRPPGERRLAVTIAVRAPAARDAASAAFVAPVPPSCEIPMTRPAPGGSQRQLERLFGQHDGAGEAGRRQGVAEDLGRALRAVLRRPAAGHDDRLAGRRRPSRIAAARAAAPLRGRVAPEQPAGQRRLGLDHLGHVVRRAGTVGWAARCTPTDRADPAGGRSDRTRARSASVAPSQDARIRRRPHAAGGRLASRNRAAAAADRPDASP